MEMRVNFYPTPQQSPPPPTSSIELRGVCVWGGGHRQGACHSWNSPSFLLLPTASSRSLPVPLVTRGQDSSHSAESAALNLHYFTKKTARPCPGPTPTYPPPPPFNVHITKKRKGGKKTMFCSD